MNHKIDIVITWVDGNDKRWRMEKAKFAEKYCSYKKSNSDIRFQSWDNLQYWFRGIEKFMPWVNKIFFITWEHIPDFLNLKHPKLKIVKHSDYLPQEYLPTYNSNTIEMNLHRITELEENFILFNDDLFVLQPMKEEYFFKNNCVCDEAIENIIVTNSFGTVSNMARYTQINNMFLINKYFDKREVQKKNWEKWYCKDYEERLERTKSLQYWNTFTGFYDPHLANAMKKTTLSHLWELEYDILHSASLNHFRAYTDVTQYLIRYWQLCEGEFYPRKTRGKVFFADIHNYREIAEVIEKQSYPMISINEGCTDEEFLIMKTAINQAFEEILPNKSSFEL